MVHLIDEYYLDNDAMNFMLKKRSTIKDEKSKNYGKENFTVVAYCPKFEQILKQLHKIKVLEGSYTELSEILVHSDSISKALVGRALELTEGD